METTNESVCMNHDDMMIYDVYESWALLPLWPCLNYQEPPDHVRLEDVAGEMNFLTMDKDGLFRWKNLPQPTAHHKAQGVAPPNQQRIPVETAKIGKVDSST